MVLGDNLYSVGSLRTRLRGKAAALRATGDVSVVLLVLWTSRIVGQQALIAWGELGAAHNQL